MGRLFGTDGVRGIATEKLNIELAMRLGSAAAVVISGNSRRRPAFVVGMDSRCLLYTSTPPSRVQRRAAKKVVPSMPRSRAASACMSAALRGAVI